MLSVLEPARRLWARAAESTIELQHGYGRVVTVGVRGLCVCVLTRGGPRNHMHVIVHRQNHGADPTVADVPAPLRDFVQSGG